MRSLKLDNTFSRASITLLCVIAIAAAAATIRADDRWHHYTEGQYEYWDLDGNSKFKWNIDDGQWWHFSTYGSWKTLSTTGLSNNFIGNGSWYDMGYGLKYRYDLNSDYGFFGRGLVYRYYYRYGPGQWYTSGCAGGWYKIGSVGLSAGVLGDGGVYDLGSGVKFRYDVTQDYGFYHNVNQYRFYYRYTPGQWYTSGYAGGWYTIGSTGLCAGVLADGSVHSLGNGLAFRYDAAHDYGFYSRGTNYRFYYRYTPGQWYASGYGGGWYLLSDAGCMAYSLFDGTARQLGNGFEFRYDQALDYGYFLQNGNDLFSYAYTPGQWSHKGNTTDWAALTSADSSASFVGDGADHDLGNGFSYHYSHSNSRGFFTHGENDRFYYTYGASRWYHRGNAVDWAALTAGGYSAAFIGDGADHELGNGFNYSYASDEHGYFKVGDTERFYYNYAPGQWFHRGNTTDWAELTPLALIYGYSAVFIGDGHTHYLVNGVSYYYSGGNGWFKIGGHERFWYEYGQSQWSHCRAGGSWVVLSASDVSAQYVGDGTWHDLGNGWDYLYAHTSDYGYFKTGDAERFSYRYGPGQWYHKGDTTAWEALTSSNYSLAFIADGSGHDLGNGFIYAYLSGSDQGHFAAGPEDRFYYAYEPSQWYHKGDNTAWGSLSAAGATAQFVGDGAWHSLGTGHTYKYSTADGAGYFKVGTAERFYYAYDPSQWFHKGDNTAWGSLSAAGATAQFVGDGAEHYIGNGWTYSYSSANNQGSFKDGTKLRYTYSYAPSQWSHKGDNTAWATLGATGVSAQFVGDGGWYDLGNGFTYSYADTDNEGYFKVGTADRFLYAYGASQWSHKGDGTDWATLSDTGISAAFVGDGDWHDVGHGFTYQYSAANGQGYFKAGAAQRFSYAYVPSQWSHKGDTTAWATLGSTGVSARFVGDGEEHVIGPGLNYRYLGTNGEGHFTVDTTERFFYSYGSSQWSHRGDGTGWGTLSNTGVSAQFVGDGADHDTGYGLSYHYASANHRGFFKHGNNERFYYDYGLSQWHHRGNAVGWATLSNSGVYAQFVGDGAEHNLGTGFSYSYGSTNQHGYFKVGGQERFSYNYAPGQWYHKGNSTDWAELTPLALIPGYSAEFIGDGHTHELPNGEEYYYTGDNGWFKVDGQERFWYEYGPGRWHHKGDGTAWGTLSATDVSAQFVGNGTWHDLGNGFSYQYVRADNEGYFKVGSGERFFYTYGLSQWHHRGDATTWATLSDTGVSAAFVGDGNTHELGTGFTYRHVGGDSGYFYEGDALRFSYWYVGSQWFHAGDTTALATLSATGVSAQFIGDGSWHDLGNGSSYQYVTADKEGYFKLGDAERFLYGYGPSQWWHKGDSTAWAALSAEGVSAAFVGDGSWHDLGNGFAYRHVGGDSGHFKIGDAERFSYWYVGSQWFHRSDQSNYVWLSAQGCSADFVGDGGWHDLGTDWSYSYTSATDEGYFKAGSAERFFFSYGPSQWSHRGDTTAWATLSNTGISAQFVGDGAWHDIGYGFTYRYAEADGEGHFTVHSAERFSYSYGPSQWSHRGDHTDWATLSDTGVSAQFVGDGAWHDIGYGSTYQYVGANGEGHFKVGSTERFLYGYGLSQWSHRGDSTAWGTLSNTGISAQFVGDGAWHDIGYGFAYQYVGAGEQGYFDVGGVQRYSYAYGASQWAHKGNATGWATLSNTGASAAFVGDGAWHDLGTGFSYCHVGGDSGYFKLGDAVRFSYYYVGSHWYHSGNHTDLVALTQGNYSGTFIGDGADHDLGNGWLYSYLSASDYGVYSDQPGYTEFAFSYTPGQWYHKSKNAVDWAALTAANYSIGFIGDGEWHDLGNGSSYQHVGGDSGYFKHGDTLRFSYWYVQSQWFHKGDTTDLGTLSATGVSAQFVGDGEWHDLGNGFTYQYLTSNDTGYFRLGADQRFSFGYGPSQWSHRGNATDWIALTAANYSPQFVGDGGSYDLGNGWTYHYTVSDDRGYYTQDGTQRFAYSYTPSQWLHKGDNTDWGTLSATGVSLEFVGDGGWHNLGNGFNYSYTPVEDFYVGYFRDDVDNVNEGRFAFAYVEGYWYHTTRHWDWVLLSDWGGSAQFVGDGGWHYMGSGWWYSYDPQGHTAYWARGSGEQERFYYTYTIGLWQHKGDWGLFHHLGPDGGWWDPTFLGDGAWHRVPHNDNNEADYEYSYDYGADNGYWKNLADHTIHWKYYYDTGDWYFLNGFDHWDHKNGPEASTQHHNPGYGND